MTIVSRSANVARRSIVMAQMYAGAISQGAMNSTIVISRPSLGSFDDETRAYTSPEMEIIYPVDDDPGMDKASITTISGSTQMDLGDEPTYYSNVTVRIPLGSPQPRIDDVILVTDSPDVYVDGRQFRVTDVPGGGRILTTIQMQAVGISPSRQWV